MKKLFFILSIVFVNLFAADCYALSVGTHKAINSYILANNTSLQSTLKNYNLPKGLDEPFDAYDPEAKTVRNLPINDIIANGGITEDTDPILYSRSFNHFHDPLAPDNNWGLTGFNWFVPPVSNLYIIATPLFYTGRYYHDSSAVWAQKPSQSSAFGNYSWPDAREYFYL